MQSITITNMSTGERVAHAVNAELHVGQAFRLIGRSVEFVARRVYEHPVAGAMVLGESGCGYRTAARVCDTLVVA